MSPPVYLVGTAAVTENLLKRKWSIVILRHLHSGLVDPAAICKAEPELTITVINERLRTMLRYSLITRNPVRTVAKMIEYRLTPRGKQMLEMLTFIERLDELTERGELQPEKLFAQLAPRPPLLEPEPESPKKKSRTNGKPASPRSTVPNLQTRRVNNVSRR